MITRLLTALLLTGAITAAAGCSGGSGAQARDDLLVVVSAPLSSQPWIGRFALNGVRLAADELNAGGGVDAGGSKRHVSVEVIDNEGSAQQAVAAARTAVSKHALALVTDGTGARAVAAVTDPADLPVFVVWEGGTSLVDARDRPTLFRMAPANKPMATRLADYVAERKPKAAVITDSSSFGRGGLDALDVALERDRIPVLSRQVVSPTATDLSPQVVKARRSGADTVIVWARSTVVAAAVRAVREAGWAPAVFTGPTGEDPIVRQQLDDHPTWLDGVTFVSFRITAEVGPAPFEEFRSKYERRFGAEKVGVRAGGRDVIMPPDWAMYGYDSTKLVAAALTAAKGRTGAPLMQAMETVVITGANGDERGFTPTGREGVSVDDMYFATFKDKRFVPVDDDILSTSLKPVGQ